MFIVVSYDIKMNEKGGSVLQQTFKICKKYLFRLQKSVFIGELSKCEFEDLKCELNHCIRKIDKCDIIVAKNIKNIVHYDVSKHYECDKTLIL